MANYWGTTNVSEWGIAGSSISVTVSVVTESTAPQVFVTIRSNSLLPSDFPVLSAPRVAGMAQAGFTATIQTADGSDFTQDLLEQANLHIDYLVHD